MSRVGFDLRYANEANRREINSSYSYPLSLNTGIAISRLMETVPSCRLRKMIDHGFKWSNQAFNSLMISGNRELPTEQAFVKTEHLQV